MLSAKALPVIHMLKLSLELIRATLREPWKAFICLSNLFAFTIIFFITLAASYVVKIDIARYDFVSFSLIATYGLFFFFHWRNTRYLLIHIVVHFLGLLFEIYKVNKLSWVYPDQAWLMFWGVPFYSGFMYTALVDFVCQVMHRSKFQIMRELPWKTIGILSLLIYLNFFIVHLTRVDFRYLLVVVSVFLIYRLPVRMTVKKTTIDANLLSIMIVFSCMVWVAENIATFSGAWLYMTQLDGWVPVSPHKLVSWYLLGQFFVFIVIYLNVINPRFFFSTQPKPNISQQLLKEK